MTLQQIALVQESWNRVLALSDAAAQLFYARLFALDPSLAPMFHGDMREQGRKLVAMIGVAVQGLARIETLAPVIEALGRRHAGYGVRDHHYATVAEALLWTLEQALGKAFTAETKEAWTVAYGLLATTMRGAAQARAA
ncbi:hemin receptor [Betaproteobacteria bacterium SCGC AG-212-J23]|nr:hemin receptor [Betaproteobacteria bacterium SCGC AG-212-J23]